MIYPLGLKPFTAIPAASFLGRVQEPAPERLQTPPLAGGLAASDLEFEQPGTKAELLPDFTVSHPVDNSLENLKVNKISLIILGRLIN